MMPLYCRYAAVTLFRYATLSPPDMPFSSPLSLLMISLRVFAAHHFFIILPLFFVDDTPLFACHTFDFDYFLHAAD